MVEDPFLPFMAEVTEIGDEVKEAYAEVDDLKVSENLNRSCSYPMDLPNLPHYILDNIVSRLEDARFIPRISSLHHRPRSRMPEEFAEYFERLVKFPNLRGVLLASLFGEDGQTPLIGGRRIAIVVSAVVLLCSLCCISILCIGRGGSKAGSSGSLDFRDTFISTLLFLAAYVWIKFRDVIPRGAVYRKPGSNKFEPRIKFPVTRGAGGKSKRIPLGLYDTATEAEAAYRIAAFYCNKPRHCLGRLDLGGGAYFPIPALSVDPNLPYKEKVKQVGDQVLKVYAEFEEQKASRNLLPGVPGLAFDMPTGEGQLSATSPIQQLQEPLNSGMDSVMQCQGFELGPNTHNRVDFNNPGSLLLLHAETQHELIGAYKQQEHLKAQVSRTDVENMGWEVKYSELERKYLELEQRNLQLEDENGLLKHQNMQLLLQTQEQELDPNRFLMMGHEE